VLYAALKRRSFTVLRALIDRSAEQRESSRWQDLNCGLSQLIEFA
jgi:hypothetical protein